MSSQKFLYPNSSEWHTIDIASDDTPEDKKMARDNKAKLQELLLSAMTMQNIVVLSGSGTSLNNAPKMGPSMGDLWEACTKSGNVFSDKAKEVFTILDYKPDNQNIEHLLSTCEAYLQLKNPVKDDDPVKIFVSASKKTILTNVRFDTTDKLEGHKTFIHRLSRRRARDSRLKLFTTNYDTCFEEAAGSQGIVVVDGFSFTRPRRYDPRFFDYDIVRRSSNGSTDTFLEGVFQLYKLHGSVNWARKGNAIEECEASADEMCMIFPAKEKYQQSYLQPHLELMARYLAALREPNTCLVITGFGFNDDHLSEPILSAIKTNPHLKVIIADFNAKLNLSGSQAQCSPFWDKFKKLKDTGSDITFINASFSQFAECIPDLSALTPAEKLVQVITQVAGGQS